MINIGIEENHGLIYEGDGNFARGLWPTPVITPAKFVYSSEEGLRAHPSSNVFGYRFREDSFDPIARIRRGRFYHSGKSQPIQWDRVSHHPGFPLDAIDPLVHAKRKQLQTFYGNPIWHELTQGKGKMPLVLLGVDNRFSTWTIINVEAIATGEDLITLKAKSSFGILPQINEKKIPRRFQRKLNETLSTFVDEAHRASPTSVIDRARDVAAHAVIAYFKLQGSEVRDLGKLVLKLNEKGLFIAANAANIINRLHSRAKPAEHEKRILPQIREQDAELAIHCASTLLCEIGFAEWA